jgi:hypothetical protein
MLENAAYYRARLVVIEDLYKSLDTNRDEKNPERVIVRNGVFPDRFNEKELIQQKLTNKNILGQTLTFEELTRFNNWFAMHPEKVAGKEIITSSREFPISIVGTKEDILKTIQTTKRSSYAFNHRSKSEGDQASDDDDFQFKLKVMQKSAKAKLKLLSL